MTGRIIRSDSDGVDSLRDVSMNGSDSSFLPDINEETESVPELTENESTCIDLAS